MNVWGKDYKDRKIRTQWIQPGALYSRAECGRSPIERHRLAVLTQLRPIYIPPHIFVIHTSPFTTISKQSSKIFIESKEN